MSNIPHIIPNARSGLRGNGSIFDALLYDGLRDPYDDTLMGNITEICAKKFNISREEQDEYGLNSYRRAKAAHENGYFKEEICPVSVVNKKGPPKVITDDEEYHKIDEARFRALQPAFEKTGTITAGNASKISDGASALVLLAEDVAKARGLKPIARIVGYGDAELAPVDFPIAPASATQIALKNAGLTLDDISYFEMNEAFSVVPIANGKLLGIPLEKINVHGGAVALGHPIGCSGARILTTLASVLKIHNGKYGLATICNGGGGASALILEKL
jgi:acetyl-CoA C-acetyltransferase